MFGTQSPATIGPPSSPASTRVVVGENGRGHGAVADAALELSVLSGADPCDATTANEPVPDFAGALTGNVTGLRVGVPRAFVSEGVDDDVRGAFDGALDDHLGRSVPQGGGMQGAPKLESSGPRFTPYGAPFIG